MEKIKVAFTIPSALGDAIIAKKVFEAIINIENNCKFDLFCVDEKSSVYATAFYIESSHVDKIFLIDENFSQKIKNYDLALSVHHSITINFANTNRLQTLSQKLLESINNVTFYNRKYIYCKDVSGQILFNIARARILKINRFTTLACEGALPITNNHVEINLSPEWEDDFEKLGLKNYITIGSNGGNFHRHSVKEWPTRYYVKFISLLKSKMPEIKIIQTGGGGVHKIENADIHLIGKNLELVKYILKNSLLHIDCEGGPVHLASQLGTKCVVLFGATDVDYYGYSQNINLISEICTPCIGAWETGAKCLLSSKIPPCMLSITPKKVFEVTYNYLKSLE